MMSTDKTDGAKQDLETSVECPQVSVLVTVYNREAYLAETLHSILSSSFTDFEVVVVDDRSTDGSMTIARDFANADSRVRVVRNDANLGDYGNRMKAASHARGSYLKYVDSDDLIYPHTLGVMVDAMERDASVAFALSHSVPEDEQPYPWILSSAESYNKHFIGRGCFGCGPTGAIIRRSAFEEVGGFNKEWGVLSDTDLWLRLGARWSVALLPPGLVWWRRHEEQEFTKDNAATVYLELGHDLDMQTLRREECPLTDVDRNIAEARKRHQHARQLISLAIRQRKLGLATRLFRRSELSVLDLISGMKRRR